MFFCEEHVCRKLIFPHIKPRHQFAYIPDTNPETTPISMNDLKFLYFSSGAIRILTVDFLSFFDKAWHDV